MPAWTELPEAIRAAWDAASYAIVEAACRAGEKCGPGKICGADGSNQRCCVDDCECKTK